MQLARRIDTGQGTQLGDGFDSDDDDDDDDGGDGGKKKKAKAKKKKAKTKGGKGSGGRVRGWVGPVARAAWLTVFYI